MATQAEFEDAATRAKSLPDQPSEVLLELYSLYKQATLGDATGDKPGLFNIAGRLKYDAWASREGMSKDDAMTGYKELVDKLGG